MADKLSTVQLKVSAIGDKLSTVQLKVSTIGDKLSAVQLKVSAIGDKHFPTESGPFPGYLLNLRAAD